MPSLLCGLVDRNDGARHTGETDGEEGTVVRGAAISGARLWAVAIVLVVSLALASGAVTAADQASSDPVESVVFAGQTGDSAPPQWANAGDEAEEDPFHVSDETLAVSIFIPAIFLVSTVWLVWWAWNRRIKPEDREDEYRPNR